MLQLPLDLILNISCGSRNTTQIAIIALLCLSDHRWQLDDLPADRPCSAADGMDLVVTQEPPHLRDPSTSRTPSVAVAVGRTVVDAQASSNNRLIRV